MINKAVSLWYLFYSRIYDEEFGDHEILIHAKACLLFRLSRTKNEAFGRMHAEGLKESIGFDPMKNGSMPMK